MNQLDVELFVIDMSNICWDRSLPPLDTVRPTTTRFIDIAHALSSAKPHADVRVVADNSLRHAVAENSRTWRQLCKKYRIEEVPVADDLILDIAAQSPRVAVISRDQFLDHRKKHPWIPSRDKYFLKPVCNSGEIEFSPSGVRFVSHHAVSQMIEVKQLRRLGIDMKRHRSVLETQWKCVNDDCLQSRLWDVLLLWPEVDARGRAHCPTCTTLLESVGKRPPACEFIVFNDATSEELGRFPIEAGRPTVIGRGVLRNGVSLDVLCSTSVDIGRISRQHVLIELGDDGRIQITDLNSSNGTSIRRVGTTTSMRLEPHSPVVFGRRDWVNLGHPIRLELSGQTFIPNPNFKASPAGTAYKTRLELK